MKKIAILAFHFSETTLCLAKYLAKNGVIVDYYLVEGKNQLKNGRTEAFEFLPQKLWRINRLDSTEMPELASYMEKLPVHIHVLGIDTSRRFLGFHKWFLCYFYGRIRKKNYDAINIVGQSNLVFDCHKALKGQNLIHTFHEIGSHQDGVSSSLAVDISVKDHSKVILHSQSTYRRYVSLSGVDNKNVYVVPFGKFETAILYVKNISIVTGLPTHRPTFLFFGALKPYKGLDVLALAMKLLVNRHHQFNLIVAGSGKDESLPYFKTLSNCFVLNKYLSNNEMMNLIKMSDILLLPYRTASQTGIIPTCALYSKPVIATAVGAFPEMVRNGGNGLLVEPNDAKVFADAMLRCIDNPNLLDSLSKGMSLFGNGDSFDWNEIAQRTQSVYFN